MLGQLGFLSGTLTGSNGDSSWIRPIDWPSMPLSVANHIDILVAVSNNDSNFCAVNATVVGGYTVDWGDGTVENVASGVQRDHQYSFINNSYLGSVTSRGYKTAIIKIYPQAANSITAFDLGLKNATAGLAAYSNPWLDIQVNAPSATVMVYRGGVDARWLERIKIVAIGGLTSLASAFTNLSALETIIFPSGSLTLLESLSNAFSGCSALIKVDFPSGSLTLLTDLSNAFLNGSSFQRIIFPAGSLGAVTTIEGMVSGCSSLIEIEFPFGQLDNVVVTTNAFLGCANLERIVNCSIPVSFTLPCNLSSVELDNIYRSLPIVVAQTITVTGNWGTENDTPIIAENKGWIVESGLAVNAPYVYDFGGAGAFPSWLTFTRASTATYFDKNGDLQTAAIDVPRFGYNPLTKTPLGFISEAATTNLIRNNTMQNAVAGTPGTAPVDWSITTNANGLSSQIVSVSSQDNIEYIDLRFFGTTTSADPNQVYFEQVEIVAALNNVFRLSAFLALVGGSNANITNISLDLDQRTAGGVFLAYVSGTNIYSNLTSSMLRLNNSLTAGTATVGLVGPLLTITPSGIGVAIDITIRIGLPQLELKGWLSTVVKTSGATVTRSADVAVFAGAVATALASANYSVVVQTQALASSNASVIGANGIDYPGLGYVFNVVPQAMTSQGFAVSRLNHDLYESTSARPNLLGLSVGGAARYLTTNGGTLTGSTVATDAAVIPIGPRFATSSTSGYPLTGNVNRIEIWDTSLTSAHLEQKTKQPQTVCWGDSLTDGTGSIFPTVNGGFPGYLTSYVGNHLVIKKGYAGQTSAYIATQMVADTSHINDNVVIWTGRNNITSVSAVLNATASMVAHLGSNTRYLILGVTNETDEPSGSANYIDILEINDALAAAYPDNYLDIRSLIVAASGGANDAPSSAWMYQGSVHFNDNAYQFIAQQILSWGRNHGWLGYRYEYDRLVFYDDFDDAGTVDLANTGSDKFKWFIRRPWGSSPSDPAKISIANSVATVRASLWGAYADATKSTYYTGNVFGGGAYFEARIRFNPADGLNSTIWFPAFWAPSIEHMYGASMRPEDEQWPGQALYYVHWCEVDFFEAYQSAGQDYSAKTSYLGTITDWSGIFTGGAYPGRVMNNTGKTQEIGTPDWANWHVYGCLWVPQRGDEAGHVQWFYDDIPGGKMYYKGPVTDPSFAGYASGSASAPRYEQATEVFSVIDNHRFVLTFGSDPNWPMDVDWIKVWQR